MYTDPLKFWMAQLGGGGHSGPLMKRLIADASVPHVRGIGISPATRRAAQRAAELERARELISTQPCHQMVQKLGEASRSPSRNGDGFAGANLDTRPAPPNPRRSRPSSTTHCPRG